MALFKKAGIAKTIDDTTHNVQTGLADRIRSLFGDREEAGRLENVVQGGARMIGDFANPARQFGITSSIQSGAGKAVAKMAGKAQKASVPAKRIHDMSLKDIEQQIKVGSKTDAQVLTDIFGKEGAKKYKSLERQANNYNIPEGTRSKASSQLADMEDVLPKDLSNKLFGIGEDIIDIDLMKDLRKEMVYIRGQGGSAKELGEALKYNVTRLGDNIDPSKMNNEQLTAFMGMREALSIAKKEGFSLKEVSAAAIKGSAERFSDPIDAAFMLEKFLKKVNKSLPSEVIKEAKIAIK